MSGVGLSNIFPGIFPVQLPFVIQNREELKYVLYKMKPYFEENIETKGFKMLEWLIIGWAHFFSRKPIIYPNDLKNRNCGCGVMPR